MIGKSGKSSILSICFVLLLVSCGKDQPQIFKPLPANASGIHFVNEIAENDQHNVFNFMNIYTGAGIAAGDINNDGLTDLYFSGNMVSGRLYLNRGNLRFEDITASAGVENTSWGTGATMLDINQDGWQDLYVCVSGGGPVPERANLLYINNGDNTFTESAGKYGLADTRQVMHAASLDYDKDGDLDLFLIVNPAAYEHQVNRVLPRKLNGESLSTDVLYRNNGDNTFTDVSREAGILIEGYSLGVAVSDINNDGWPDIYISNDFVGSDILYINNGNGTFSDRLKEHIKHTSYAGMGNDVADINNDGLVDIMVLDMRPEDNKRQKLIISSTSYDLFQLMIQQGYGPQYSRNTLQLNRGSGAFSEIGFLAGVSSTDWSWSALLADYDNDRDRDLFVTNGFLRDLGNLDYIHYQNIYNNPMGTVEAKMENKMDAIKSLEGADLQNYLFENNGDVTFTNRSDAWGIREKGFSNGALYADLDNDGDLDLVVNNINDKAQVYENRSDRLLKRNFLRIDLLGSQGNRDGIGAKLRLSHQGQIQFYEHYLQRGYESSIDPVIHFGLDTLSRVDSLEIFWPDGAYQLLKNVEAGQFLTLDHSEASLSPPSPKENVSPALFREITGSGGLDYRHRENEFVDFKVQPILPHMYSRNGPGLAVGDINGDGLEDFYIGGASGYPGYFYRQRPDGGFQATALLTDAQSEDMGALFFDADNDNDQDLYVVSGGGAHPAGSAAYQDRLYLNDGQGNFSRSEGALPPIAASGSCIVAADYDRDGDLDLFVGGRIVPGAYPLPGRSYLLENEGTAGGSLRFKDVTETVAPELMEAGMVTAALWTDFDNDNWPDLLVTGEFMPLRFFRSQNGRLAEVTADTGLQNSSGWWNSLAAGDFDADGDTDYLAGNLGLNSRFRATPEEPLCIYANDYDKNGRLDPVMCYYLQGENYIAHSRDDIISQISAMRARFKTYEEYSEATFERSFLPAELSEAYLVKSERFESSYLENLGNGRFAIKALPLEAQIAPVFGMMTGDFDQDGNLDALLTGNSYSTEVATGRYDASIGLLLKGDGQGGFSPVDAGKSGFFVDGEARGMARLRLATGKNAILVSCNSGQMRAFVDEREGVTVEAAPDEVKAVIQLRNGKRYQQEFYYGSTYLSQSSRSVLLSPETSKVEMINHQGKSRVMDYSDIR